MIDNTIITQDSLNLDKTIVTIALSSDEEVSVVKKAVKSPNYYRVGNGTMNRSKIKSIDLLREIAEASSPAQFVLLTIKDGITYENGYSPVVQIKSSTLTSTQQQYLKRGYKELHERDLVRRVKRGYYMINPNALIPVNYEAALAQWELCKAYVPEEADG